ncbi:uncharacterized protein LOC106171285 isoform X2 [Lingula anatina]|uniref:Uncharacterized protein LOC106171285 isoform X2 n=1 Tax=Lingula anatina TaxID=7574 RepID=A0A1S3J9E3_LINAN|nr:uncharacterized protein LOC106171285 isoform X2 [Lingula anatina]|eukprot:XP_013407022.1 uncharacterized protein LOC106171285 isoform X2 [Lingula anatina]
MESLLGNCRFSGMISALLASLLLIVLSGIDTVSSQIQIKFDPQRDCYNYYNLKNEKLYGDRCAQDQKCCGTCYYRYCCKEEYASSKVNQLLCTNNDVEGTYATEMPPGLVYLTYQQIAAIIATAVVGLAVIVTSIVLVVMWRKRSGCFNRAKP